MTHRRLALLLTSIAQFAADPFTARAQSEIFQSNMSLVWTNPIIMKPPSGVHKSTLIFLHGLGDSGSLQLSSSSHFAVTPSVVWLR